MKGMVSAALLSCVLLSVGAQAQVSGGIVKIGVLGDQSGAFSGPTGKGSVLAAQMALEDFGPTVNGAKIELVSADHQNKVDVGSNIARTWFDQDGVDMITDLGNSAVALAVSDLGKQKNKAVAVAGGAVTALTGKACNAQTVHWVFDSYSQANTFARAVLAEGLKTWFFLTVDFAYGLNLEETTAGIVKELGGTVVGSVRHPLTNSDFSSFLIQAQASKAQVVALANGGSDTANSLKQAQEFGLTKNQRIAGLAMSPLDVHGVGLATAQGALVAEAYYWDMNDETRAFGKRFFARHGAYPTMQQAGVYSAVLHYLKSVKAANTDDGALIVAKMKELPTEDPIFGKGYVRADGRKIHDFHLFQVKTPAESKYPWDYYKLVRTVPGDQAFMPMSKGGCPLVAGK